MGAQNAGAQNTAQIVFTPLTDAVPGVDCSGNPINPIDASIGIGALAVQPGGTGVILAGTGDPNDALDSYYGAGILRSADNGNTWCLIQITADQQWSFVGEGFAGIAFSTANPQLVVAAVSQAYEGTLVNAIRPGVSYEGLYYSTDGGATWNLATITDGPSDDVQGPNDPRAVPDGNAATSVVWNPVRGMFLAAVRYHGYYQSTDGMTWTRLADQPGTSLITNYCPTNPASLGSPYCPIFRGSLAVNPVSGDTFAWTVDINLQDQGLWQDQCALSGGACGTQNPTFARQWSTTALEADTSSGAETIVNGDYNLALAAVPSGQDTLLLAGDNDLWKCSLALGCPWRNTTNAFVGQCAQVSPYQHALAWNSSNPLEIFVGNDGGLWRSTDAIGETGQVCASTDASHFQNLNGTLQNPDGTPGSLAELVSMAQAASTPYTIMAGLGVNGTAVRMSNSPNEVEWPEILGGEGGPVAINPVLSAWYVNNQAGVSIDACDPTGTCTASGFVTTPVVDDADTGNDGLTMTPPAPFLVDALDPTQLLIGTCRVWRGPADGVGWSASNAISPILDGGGSSANCHGDSLIRSLAALALPSSTALPKGGEVVYVGIYGSATQLSIAGGQNIAGHIRSAVYNASTGVWSAWADLTLNPVTNDSLALNYYQLDISSIVIDPHDPTGNTVYVTVAGFSNPTQEVQVLYRSTDGGANWANLTANLPAAPANSLAVDPQDACTVYLATDVGVYSTREAGDCSATHSNCWALFGSGLPAAPVVQLSAASPTASAPLITAGTYGRGVWQANLWTAGQPYATGSASPASLSFPSQAVGQ